MWAPGGAIAATAVVKAFRDAGPITVPTADGEREADGACAAAERVPWRALRRWARRELSPEQARLL